MNDLDFEEKLIAIDNVIFVDQVVSVRTVNCLKRAGVNALGVLRMGLNGLCRIPNMGRRSAKEVYDLFLMYGIEISDNGDKTIPEKLTKYSEHMFDAKNVDYLKKYEQLEVKYRRLAIKYNKLLSKMNKMKDFLNELEEIEEEEDNENESKK